MIVKPKNLDFSNKHLSMIIAGLAGLGKTTLALSAPSPLLIDLDNGISRVEAKFRKDVDMVKSYDELVRDLKGDLSAYETIIIDTGGALFDMLKPVVIAEDRKNGKSDGSLSLNGYGACKRKFMEFAKFLKTLDKNIIWVFHAQEVALSDDTTGLRIYVEGGIKTDIWRDIDLGGFVEMRNNKRTIGFSVCDRYYCKGTHHVHGIYEIPDLENPNQPNDFITKLFQKVREDLCDEQSVANEYNDVMDEYKPKIESAKTLKDVNEAYEALTKAPKVSTSANELWFALKAKAKELGFLFDKEKGAFAEPTKGEDAKQ